MRDLNGLCMTSGSVLYTDYHRQQTVLTEPRQARAFAECSVK
jgi:hypothetical protein